MSWFQQNKFTAIFGGVTAVIAGALGWLVMGAKSDLEAKQEEFKTELGKLSTLQGGKPFPNEKNVAAYKAEFARVEGTVLDLHQKLVASELPLEEVPKNVFQDRLKQAVDRIKSEALAKKMLLPGQKKDDVSAVAADATFNLGFDYLEKLPPDEASSELARELKAVEFVIQQLLANNVAQLVDVKRNTIPSEKGDKKKDEKKDDKKPATGAGKAKSDDEQKLVTHHKFEVKFVASQSSFMKILNGISGAKQPFIITRRVFIKNEKTEGPLKETAAIGLPAGEVTPPADPSSPTPPAPAPDAAAPAPGTAAVTPAPGAPKETKNTYIVGEEKLEVELELEMVDFAEAKVAVESKGKASK